jgi:hypothetical protein
MRASLATVALLGLACGSTTHPPPPPPAKPDWQLVMSGLPGALLRVWGFSSKDVYVVGANGDGQGNLFFHYDGTKWKKIDTKTSESLWWVQGITDKDVRIVGDGGVVLTYDPSSGTVSKRSAPDPIRLFGAWGCASDDVWYVGGVANGSHGVMWRDDGTSIRAPAIPATWTASTTIFKVAGFGCNDLWFVGAHGLAGHWNGTTFDRPPPMTGTPLSLFTIHGLSSDRVFAVGGGASGVLLAWDGMAWKNETAPGTPRMNGVWVAGEGTVYAAGFNGHIYKRDPSWSALDTAPMGQSLPVTFDDFHSIWVDEKGEIWAVGGGLSADPPTGGMLVHYGVPISTMVD